MHVATLVTLAAGAMAAPAQIALGQPKAMARETLEDAVLSAVNMAKHITTGTMSSVFPTGSVSAGQPYALMESREWNDGDDNGCAIISPLPSSSTGKAHTPDAPCHPDGALTFITMPISLMTRNIKANRGAATYALQTPLKKGVSEYAQPRVAFIGNLTILHDITPEEDRRLAECYVQYHPDAKWWLPGDPRGAHTSSWARLDPQDIYYIGGFGTTGWIGHIPVDKFADAMGDE